MSTENLPADPEVVAFDVCGPLPAPGVTVLEASAGTGKTFTIAALAARYVAAGIPLHQLLVVTFTRMATGELRDRVRERLVSAEQGLLRVAAGEAPPPDDAVLGLLAAGSPAELDERRRRLAAALADYDAATITTTHGFCQDVLGGLGFAGDVEREIVVLEDQRDLVAEVVDDLYVRKFHAAERPGTLSRADALRVADAAVNNPVAPIEPSWAPRTTPAGMHRSLAEAVRREMERRKRAAGVLTYDDLLIRLRAALEDPVHGPRVRARLQSRYRVVLVDEFQDTDPVQWDILRLGFGGSDATLVLIGDPKQAIYAFRGADVYAYLAAAEVAGSRATLAVNWRSDQGLIDAYDALLRGARLGHEGISYRPVRAAEANQAPRLVGAPVPAPLRLRVLHREDGLVTITPQKGLAQAAHSRALIAQDLADDLVALLSSGARVERRHRDGSPDGDEAVRPGHVAVLVRTNRQANLVREALAAVGITAVINGAGSVFATPVAREWLRLLEALERPTSVSRARSAALTAFLGWSAETVAAAGDDDWETVHFTLNRWAGVLRRHGVASLLELVSASEGLPARLLATAGGERALTDLRHVGQLLHTAASTDGLGVTALTAWLRQRIAEAEEDTNSEDRSRRLESDAEAVQVLTIHRSKGLEFPVVYLPYLWEPGYIPQRCAAVYHDARNGNVRTIDVSLTGDERDGWSDHRSAFIMEQRGEDLRLAYVALTRAKHQAVLWWAAGKDSENSALFRLLFARSTDGSVRAFDNRVPDDAKVAGEVERLGAGAPGCVSVERVVAPVGRRWTPPVPAAVDLEAGRFGRSLDRAWRRTSYTGIIAAAHDPRVASEPEAEGTTDEPEVALAAVPTGLAAAALEPDRSGGSPPEGGAPPDGLEASLRAAPSLWAALPGGADVGTFVHRILERIDFTVPDLGAALTAEVAAAGNRRPPALADGAAVVAALQAAVETPLGPLTAGRALRDFGPADRLNELHFELPLAGGDDPKAEVSIAALATLLRRFIPPGDPLAGYAERLADPALADTLRGYLSGSLDLVLRIPAGAGRGPAAARFAVVDHKTNWLGAGEEPLSAWHYRPAALAEAMQRAHYPLQALLYSVALHRYLRWRLQGYDPQRNLGGVLYLFLRGMTGAGAPEVDGQPCGVFAWQPPVALVAALSDLLDRGRVAA
ncbi:MAG TPA: UvrD-helicase domain-containing protein [Acidimicrobiia bacterium]|nr:UvrD-helicase domain-containing protein [Acidimicrobiia bacterium]